MNNNYITSAFDNLNKKLGTTIGWYLLYMDSGLNENINVQKEQTGGLLGLIALHFAQ
jgi:hypothetical protein